MNGEFVNVPLPKETTVPLCTFLERPERNGRLHLYSDRDVAELQSSLDGLFSFTYYFVGQWKSAVTTFPSTQYYKGLKIYLDFVHDPVGMIERGEIGKQQFMKKFTTRDGKRIGTPDQQDYIKKAQEYPPLAQEDAMRFDNWGVIIYTDKQTKDLLETIFPYKTYPKMILAVVDWPYYTMEKGNCDRTILRCLRFQAAELFMNQTICVRDADTLFVDHLDRNYPDLEDIVVPNNAAMARLVQSYKKLHDYATYMILWWEAEFLKYWMSEKSASLEPLPYGIMQSWLVIGTHHHYAAKWHRNVPMKIPTPSQGSVGDQVYVRMRQKGIKKPLEYSSGIGLFAGFVNFSRHRRTSESIQKLWYNCVLYLQSRYFMAGPKRIISDSLCTDITGATIGKDERLLLFVFTRDQTVRENTTFYGINYANVLTDTEPSLKITPWPLGKFGVGDQIPVFDRLCTPYYNQEIQNAKIEVNYNRYLYDKHISVQKQYDYFLQAFDKPLMKSIVQETIEECNPTVAKEHLFLENAEVRPVGLERLGVLEGGKLRGTKRRRRNQRKRTRRRRA